ncbi:MAG: LexA family transcriptional regulator [Owenweeksia sp.]|nr:LexA family transcriptional regulator [Owenweeksia sp.]
MTNPIAYSHLKELKDRVQWVRKQHHLSQVEFAHLLKVSQSVVSLIESGRANISVEVVKTLSQKFNLSTDWLIFGRENYVELCPENHFMPLIDASAQAGYMANQGKAINENPRYRIPGFEKGEFRIFEVSGDSMMPTLHPNDLVVCEKLPHIKALVEGALYVVHTYSHLLLKRLMLAHDGTVNLLLISDNPHYPQEQLAMHRVLEIYKVKARITHSFSDAPPIR